MRPKVVSGVFALGQQSLLPTTDESVASRGERGDLIERRGRPPSWFALYGDDARDATQNFRLSVIAPVRELHRHKKKPPEPVFAGIQEAFGSVGEKLNDVEKEAFSRSEGPGRGSARSSGVMPTILYPMDPVIPRED